MKIAAYLTCIVIVLFIYCYNNKVLPNLAAFNSNKHLLAHMVSAGEEFRSSWAGWFQLGVSREVIVEMPSTAAIVWGLDGAGGAASKTAHLHGRPVGAGCWWRLLHRALRLPSGHGYLLNPANDPDQERSPKCFMTSPWKSHNVISITSYWFQRSAWSVWKGTIRRHEHQEARLIGKHFGLSILQ